MLVQAFVRFVVEGLGTPAPVAPTEHLVVGGAYRYVRNPMYLAVTAVILGQALLLGQPVLVVYAAGFLLVTRPFVRRYEEPTLRPAVRRGVRRLPRGRARLAGRAVRRHRLIDPAEP